MALFGLDWSTTMSETIMDRAVEIWLADNVDKKGVDRTVEKVRKLLVNEVDYMPGPELDYGVSLVMWTAIGG